MGTIEENRNSWSHYDWSQQGDEWSACWGGTPFLWWGTIHTRIHAFLPGERILELAPGYGRITQYIKDYCRSLTLVDLAENCINACKQRFADCSHIEYHLNDGRSLAMIPDQSIDFIFSWDSMVHAEADVMEAYIVEFSRILKPGRFGFIHHSNVGALRDSEGDAFLPNYDNPHWRAESMSGELFIDYCMMNRLCCVSQERIAWGGEALNDAFSLFTTKGSPHARAVEVIDNPRFMDEAEILLRRAHLYNPQNFTG